MNQLLKYFGTDGIRGSYGGKIINEDFAFSLGKAISVHFQKRHHQTSFLLARDTRTSGESLLNALRCGLREMNSESEDLGVLPTPALAFSVTASDQCIGIMITASHNHHSDNGFKIISSQGGKLSQNEETQIESVLEPNKFPSPISNLLPNDQVKYVEQYSQNLLSKFESAFLKGLKIVVDLSNGATRQVTPRILQEFGAEVIPINQRNGLINNEVGSEFVSGLGQKVLETNADLGFAHDGDGDRVIFVSEKGNEIPGDQILGMLALHNKKKQTLKGNGFVATIHSNSGLEDAMNKNGLQLHRADVGDRNVFALMKSLKCNWGGESSGHIICTDYLNTGDGLFSALSVLQCIQSSKKKITELCKPIKLWPSYSGAVVVEEKKPLEDLKELQDCLKEVKAGFNGKGRVLVRYSGTESKVRILVESKSSESAQESYLRISQMFTDFY